VQSSGDARGECLIGCPPPKLWYWAVAYGGHCYRIYVVCDVTIWGHIHVCKPTFWRSLLTQHAYSGTPEQRKGSSPIATWGFCGLFPPKQKLQAAPNWIMKHYKSVEVLSNFRMSSTPIEKGRGLVKQLRTVETYKKVVTNYLCFCSWTVLSSKIITAIIRKSFCIFWVPE